MQHLLQSRLNTEVSANTKHALSSHPFLGRTLAIIEDFNEEERMYLYTVTRECKHAYRSGNTALLDKFRINDLDFGMYEIFLEDSTRTKESFKNAAHFHRIKFNALNASTSSFNKKESYADTFANLVGYDNNIFVVRSQLEGVCRYLEEMTASYVERHKLKKKISFINAGDGRHEHPTQELLDEFTFLEDLSWDTTEIHLAIVGDLYNGRTVHSKVNGLRLFNKVTVDLIAPPELMIPMYYIQKMKEHGFTVRMFESIQEYLKDAHIATQWYFTRPQLERMGERILNQAERLIQSITFHLTYIDKLPPGTLFYHPLPRHRESPTIPPELDNLPLNAWERQSTNGWFIRIVLLSMIAGKIGADYGGPIGKKTIRNNTNTITILEPKNDTAKALKYSEGIRPIQNGLVLDHIMKGADSVAIRNHLTTLISVMGLHGKGGEWISTDSEGKQKGLLFRPDHPGLSDQDIDKLASVIPGATINIIKHGRIIRKYRLGHPIHIKKVPELICRNPACITYPANGEHTRPQFTRSKDGHYICDYCEHAHKFTEVWR